MIDVYILNTNFEVVGVIDTYESFIWTDRWNSYGDFELYTSFDYYLIQLCQQNYYVHINQSKHTMIIEGIEVETDSEMGIKLRITGRSLESILDRRIVWTKQTVGANTKFQTAIKNIIDRAFGTSNVTPQPGGTVGNARKMTNLIFEWTNDSYIDGILVEKTEYTGDNVYDIITKMCQEANNTIGWKITLDSENHFVFKLYSGKDRSYQQDGYKKTADSKLYANKQYYTYDKTTKVYTPLAISDHDRAKTTNVDYYEEDPIVPFVIFSPDFDNIINTDYLDSTEGMKNVTLVAGEENQETQTRVSLIVGSAEDLERRELFTDARDLRLSDYEDNMSRYKRALKARGINSLVENGRMQSYEGQVEATRQFVFGEDFEMGDIVQISNEYGINGAVRVIEWVMSDSTSGTEVYPTFDAVQIIDDTEYEEE